MRRTYTRMKSVWRACWALAAFGIAGGPGFAYSAEDHSEDAIKAAFLYRFAGYVDWPPEAAPQAEFTIAVMGFDGTVDALQRLLPDHPIKDHPAQVRLINNLKELADAQMLYVPAGRADAERANIAALADRPVLVVTDDEHGLDDGSTVNFLLLDRRVRFEISLSAAERHGLRISSQLLSVAARVQGGRLRSEVFCGGATSWDRVDSGCGARLFVHLYHAPTRGLAHTGHAKPIETDGRPNGHAF